MRTHRLDNDQASATNGSAHRATAQAAWRRGRLVLFGTLMLLLGFSLLGLGRGRAAEPTIYVLPTKGIVNPAMVSYLDRGISEAENERAAAVIIELDTPGGMLDSTREIIQRFNSARVPVVVYVAPSGARAGSAGVFLTMAAHVAAMAPSTNIGAAHPVNSDGSNVDKDKSDLAEKVVNDAVALVRGQAQRHGRNADWAEEAVRKSVSIGSQEALERGVIDLIAPDRAALITALNGRTVKLPGGEVAVQAAGARQEMVDKNAGEQFFDLISNPNLALLLTVIGFNALLYELSNPSLIIPGVVGAIALLLGLYGVGTLSPNWAGLAFIGLAFALFILEVKVQSNGVLAVGAVASMLIGGLVLTANSPPWARISPLTVVAATAVTSSVFLVVIAAGIRALRRPVAVGAETLLGQVGVARTALAPNGQVFVAGALWDAASVNGPIADGDRVQIRGREGLKLYVDRVA